MRDFSDDLGALRQRLNEAQEYLRIDELRQRHPQLETEVSRPDLWDDPELAKKVNSEFAAANDDIALFVGLVHRADPPESLSGLARDENYESQVPEIERELAAVAAKLDELELRSL